MALINVIPVTVSIYAVAVPGRGPANPPKFVCTMATATGSSPHGHTVLRVLKGSVNVAMGDVDGDGILDLIVGADKDHAPEVVVYAGAAIYVAKAPSEQSWRASSRSIPMRVGVLPWRLHRSMGQMPTTSSWDQGPASRVK